MEGVETGIDVLLEEGEGKGGEEAEGGGAEVGWDLVGGTETELVVLVGFEEWCR